MDASRTVIYDLATPAPGRSRRNRGSEVVRHKLIQSGIAEFAAHGFEGASTRAIADSADAHQSQIKYHFDTKDELWRRCLELLLGELDASIAERQVEIDARDARALFEATIRGLVGFVALRPALNRIMIHEGTSPSNRLTWLVDTHLGDRRRALVALWNRVADTGATTLVDGDLVYHMLIGSASLLYANAPEARLMGIEPADETLIDRHADAIVAMFLGSSNRPDAESD